MKLIEIPKMSINAMVLDMSNNYIKKIENIPDNLLRLYLIKNNISNIENLPP
jgi:hypothetical protein